MILLRAYFLMIELTMLYKLIVILIGLNALVQEELLVVSL